MNRFIFFSLLGGILLLTGYFFVHSRVLQFTEEKRDFTIPEATPPVVPHPSTSSGNITSPRDIEPQQPLSNPPKIIKAIYATNWSAGSEKKLTSLIKLIKETELNALVVDVKDYTGYVGYNTDLELPKKYNAVELRIPRLNALVKRLHDEGIYVIGRIAVFEDQRLVLARPELALQSSSTKAVWRDRKGVSWMDTASKEVWEYNAAIAKEVLARGMDEVNFDYIRFASDGDLEDIVYPMWDGVKLKTKVIGDFFKYVRSELPDAKISADLFGLVTVNADGLGIGQQLEYAFPYVDVVSPMVYPSHYFTGFIGYKNPAEYPYEVVKYSMESAVARLRTYNQKQITTATSSQELSVRGSKLSVAYRPWFQDFDLGADYDAQKVRAQITAFEEAASTTPEFMGGWMLWNPSNVYTREALKEEK